MKIVKATEGEYIDYSVSKSKVTFADELTLNLEKRERDFDVSIDVCIDRDGAVTAGQLGVKYAAQIEIPAREYTEEEVSNPDYDPEDSTSKETIINKVPVPFSMNNVTLKLYAI